MPKKKQYEGHDPNDDRLTDRDLLREVFPAEVVERIEEELKSLDAKPNRKPRTTES